MHAQLHPHPIQQYPGKRILSLVIQLGVIAVVLYVVYRYAIIPPRNVRVYTTILSQTEVVRNTMQPRNACKRTNDSEIVEI